MMPFPDSLSAFLLVFLLVVAEKERRYFLNRTAPMVELPVPSPSHEVMVEAGRQFRALRRSLIQMVMDVCGVLGILVLTAYTVRIILLGRDSLSCGEMSHVVLLVLWLLTCSAFHTGVLTYGEGQIIFLMYVFNLLTLGMTVYIDEVAKPMLEPMIVVGRIVGSLVFLDWRHAICCNCLFAARRFQQRAHEDFAQLANSFVSEFCVCTLILIVPWALQVLMQKWISIIVAASDLDMALRAAKAVIASSCDAEAEMTSDLRLHQVSFKLAHMLGQQPSELEGKHFSKMLQEESRQRFEACCQAARAQAERTSQPAASSVIVTVNARSARKDVEVRICNLSPLSQGGGRYIAALLEVGNSPEEAPDALQEDEADSSALIKEVECTPMCTGPGLTAELLESHSWASRKNHGNLSCLSEVKVLLDAQTLEIQDIHIFLNTSHWKKSRKTFLKECILPGIWEDFRRWLESSSKGRQGSDPPFIIPFGFPRVMGGVACARNCDVKQKVGPTGRSELSLRLRHIFIRRPAMLESQVAECRLGTPSIASRGTL